MTLQRRRRLDLNTVFVLAQLDVINTVDIQDIGVVGASVFSGDLDATVTEQFDEQIMGHIAQVQRGQLGQGVITNHHGVGFTQSAAALLITPVIVNGIGVRARPHLNILDSCGDNRVWRRRIISDRQPKRGRIGSAASNVGRTLDVQNEIGSHGGEIEGIVSLTRIFNNRVSAPAVGKLVGIVTLATSHGVVADITANGIVALAGGNG